MFWPSSKPGRPRTLPPEASSPLAPVEEVRRQGEPLAPSRSVLISSGQHMRGLRPAGDVIRENLWREHQGEVIQIARRAARPMAFLLTSDSPPKPMSLEELAALLQDEHPDEARTLRAGMPGHAVAIVAGTKAVLLSLEVTPESPGKPGP